MNSEWSLDVLYKSYEDENYKKDMKNLEGFIKEFKAYVSNLSFDQPKETLLTLISLIESIELTANKLYSYTSLRQSTNTTDAETTSLLGKLQKLLSETAKEDAIVNKFIPQIPNLSSVIASDEKLTAYSYMIKRIVENSKHTLSDEVEEVISKLNLSAGTAWGNLQQYLTSTVVVDYKDEKTTLSAIRNLAYNPDPVVRKEAYEAELKAYDKIKDSVCFSLNNIKVQVNTICQLRGYESPLAMTLNHSRLTKETLDAMLSAMKEYLPKFHTYLKKKADMLGYSNGLPWYELFAPIGESSKSYTTEEAKEMLLELFGGFADDLRDMTEHAFDDAWIDFYPRQGKVGGAFCANLPFVKQSRVLTNFDGSLSDVVTLAHELGHAYHGLLIQDHLPLNTDYTMPVAETASNFNETIVMNSAISKATGNEKLALIESQLQDITQIMCDIYSRYLFETAVFNRSQNEFLFSDELCKIMLECQKEAYGDGLDHSQLHPYMWVCKGHYYSSGLSFYNFPYAFGGLFARGLYAKYEKEGASFVPKYRALLNATTVSSVEEVAKMADIDLTQPTFWKEGLESFSQLVDEFIKLVDQK